MNDLSEGVRVDRVVWPDDSQATVGPRDGIKEMLVSMQAGQGGMVPWVKIYRDKGVEQLVNCAMLATVELAPVEKPATQQQRRTDAG